MKSQTAPGRTPSRSSSLVTDDSSWILRLPEQIVGAMLAVAMIVSHWSPCDSTLVANGESMFHVLCYLGIATLTAVALLLRGHHAFRNSGNPFATSTISAGDAMAQLRWMSLIAVVFGCWLIVVCFTVPGRGNARFAFNGTWQWLSTLLMVVATVVVARRSQLARSLSISIVACAVGFSVYAVYQYFISFPAMRADFESNPIKYYNQLGLNPGSATAIQFQNRVMSTEPTGPFSLTNSLAGLVACSFVVLTGWTLDALMRPNRYAARETRSNAGASPMAAWAVWGVSVLCLILMAIVLLLTKSRTAWIACGVCTIGVVFTHGSIRPRWFQFVLRNKVLVASAIAFCCVILSVVYYLDSLIFSEAFKSLTYRMEYWKGAIELVKAQPMFGYGALNFLAEYQHVKLPTASESPADPHNFFLEVAVAGGVPLALALLAILIGLIRFWWTRIICEGNDGVENAASTSAESRNTLSESGWFWGGLIAASFGLIVFTFFTADDATLISALLSVLVGGAFAVMLARSTSFMPNTLVQQSVRNYANAASWGAATVLIHMTASGGWMQPGAMFCLCVCIATAIAIGANGSDNAFGFTSNATDEQASSMSMPQHATLGGSNYTALTLLGLSLAVSAGFVVTTFLPVSRAAEQKRLASSGEFGHRVPEDLFVLLYADVRDPEIANLAGEICIERLERPLTADLRRRWKDAFERCAQAMIDRDPANAITVAQCGRLSLKIAATESDSAEVKRFVAAANRYFARSVELYPTSSEAQLQAALAATVDSQFSAAESHLKLAAELDEKTPHRDRKINAAMVYFPARLEPGAQSGSAIFDSQAPRLDAAARAGLPNDYARGEPVLRWMRSYLDRKSAASVGR